MDHFSMVMKFDFFDVDLKMFWMKFGTLRKRQMKYHSVLEMELIVPYPPLHCALMVALINVDANSV